MFFISLHQYTMLSQPCISITLLKRGSSGSVWKSCRVLQRLSGSFGLKCLFKLYCIFIHEVINNLFVYCSITKHTYGNKWNGSSFVPIVLHDKFSLIQFDFQNRKLKFAEIIRIQHRCASTL